jgi:hypothetical protein
VVSNRALKCAHFCFSKMPFKTHDDASQNLALLETKRITVQCCASACKGREGACKGQESAFVVQVVKVLAEAVGERVEAVGELVEAVRMLVEAARMLEEAVTGLVARKALVEAVGELVV